MWSSYETARVSFVTRFDRDPLVGLFLTLWIPCTMFCGTIAEDKGQNGISLFWDGLLFGSIGLLAVEAFRD